MLNRPAPNEAATWAVLILNLMSIALGIVMNFRMRRWRWFSASVFLFTQWMLQGMNLVAIMPIGGVWL